MDLPPLPSLPSMARTGSSASASAPGPTATSPASTSPNRSPRPVPSAAPARSLASYMRRYCLAVLRSTGLCATAPMRLSAQEDPRVVVAVQRLTAEIVAVRQDIHRNPELGNRETRTARIVADRLRALGLEVRTGVAHTGVVGILRGGRPGPVVAVRADMDALPVTEQTDLPFASTVRVEYDGQQVGVAHACGHDIHVAVALGTAAVLAERRAQLSGTVVFVFQPAEEGPPVGEEEIGRHTSELQSQ